MPGKSNSQNSASPLKSPEKMRFDVDDPEYIRDLQRPAVIKEDLNEMERRKRVRQILESKMFREELEQLIYSEKSRGTDDDHLKTLEQLSELILPASHLRHVTLGTIKSHAILPVADLRGPEAARLPKQERILRNKLASLYRLVDLFQWSQGIYNHNSVRLTTDSGDVILTNPFGLLFHEIAASSLVKASFTGQVLDSGSSGFGINKAGYVLHTAIYEARPDVRCVIHMHTPAATAVAAMKCGFLPISQEAMIVGPVSYHDYQGIVNDEDEKSSIAADIGTAKVMFLRNHGFVACGATIADAFHLAYNVILACEIQIRSLRGGIDNLIIPNADARNVVTEVVKDGVDRVNMTKEGSRKINWGSGELEWEAWMRVLDSAGYRTGHIYRQPFLSGRSNQPQSDVAQPPAASSRGTVGEGDIPDGQILHGKNEGVWLNSPNAYTKLVLKETGTVEPKTYTKWVQDMNSSTSVPVKLVPPNQFIPITSSSKEFKEKRSMLKEARRIDTISAGPQSKVLDPVAWQEIEKIREADVLGSEDKVMIGAASKGIIEREFRHNAQVYQQLYQPNPFAVETDSEIKAYLKEVERKNDLIGSRSTENLDESPSPESVSLMLAARDHQTLSHTDDTPTSTASSKTRGSWFQRSKSERFNHSRRSDRNTSLDDSKALSDDEIKDKDKKKRMFKTPNLFSRNRKDKKKVEATAQFSD